MTRRRGCQISPPNLASPTPLPPAHCPTTDPNGRHLCPSPAPSIALITHSVMLSVLIPYSFSSCSPVDDRAVLLISVVPVFNTMRCACLSIGTGSGKRLELLAVLIGKRVRFTHPGKRIGFCSLRTDTTGSPAEKLSHQVELAAAPSSPSRTRSSQVPQSLAAIQVKLWPQSKSNCGHHLHQALHPLSTHIIQLCLNRSGHDLVETKKTASGGRAGHTKLGALKRSSSYNADRGRESTMNTACGGGGGGSARPLHPDRYMKTQQQQQEVSDQPRPR